jgi:hypothetical protein
MLSEESDEDVPDGTPGNATDRGSLATADDPHRFAAPQENPAAVFLENQSGSLG